MSYILFSETDTLEYISYYPKPPRQPPHNLQTANFHQNWSPKKQEQGVMLVNDCGKMTTESAGTLGKRFYPGPSEGMGTSIPTMYGMQGTDFAPHPQLTACRSSTVRV